MTEQQEQLNAVLHKAMKKHRSIDAQVKCAWRLLTANAALLEKYVVSLAQHDLRTRIHGLRHKQRDKVKQNFCGGRGVDALQGINEIATESLLDTWYLPDGRNLRSVLGKELGPLAEQAHSCANGYRKVGDFYEALQRLTPDAKCVGDCVSNEEAGELWADVAGQLRSDTHSGRARDAVLQDAAGG